MPKVVIVVRQAGGKNPDYFLNFDLPEIPREGQYISISRQPAMGPYSEDVIVRHVWWILNHHVAESTMQETTTGLVEEIFVECDPAIGPYASDTWWDALKDAHRRGEIEEFDVLGFSTRDRKVPPES